MNGVESDYHEKITKKRRRKMRRGEEEEIKKIKRGNQIPGVGDSHTTTDRLLHDEEDEKEEVDDGRQRDTKKT